MVKDLFDLSGKTCVVSGAASGMGKQIAIGFAEYGADVVLVDINLKGAKKTESLIGSTGSKTLVVECNVSNIDEIVALFKTVDSEFGKVDVLANIAGEGHIGRPEEIKLSFLKETMDNLAISRFKMCQEAGTRMIEKGVGSIINQGSIGGWNSLGRSQTSYGMAMAAVIQMTRELSTEWASRGVRVNAILPSQVWNEGLHNRIAVEPKLEDTFISGIPIGRIGFPEEIKGLAIFLASDASSFVTGAIIPMDGGNLAMNAGGTYPGSSRIYG
jgi:NAD(P)-dependent dehydrogenase (short-subunit alcohol dehydrogenase family)|tara:strand:- start:17 stop:829 length:813 start_codon:yes stop_codon:yes gene_type:complete